MTLSVKNSSSWVVPSKVYAKDGGVWKQANQVYVRQGGNWYLMFNTATISTSSNNVNLYTLLGSPTSPITAAVEIASGVTIGSSSYTLPALTIDGFPTGSVIYLTNNGNIIGAGGTGGGRVAGTGPAARAGTEGGTAIYTRNTLKLTNNLTIASGGGGGGGGGRTNRSGEAYDDYTGVGGGGAGTVVGSGGSSLGSCPVGTDGGATLGGGGGAYCSNPGSGEPQIGSVGGQGGALGNAGNRGLPNPDFDGTNLGGRAGYAIDGISYTTKVTAGTILGTEIN